MLERVKAWLDDGRQVKIFTARVAPAPESYRARKVIEQWCHTHIGVVLPVTNIKDMGMLELWDDRAIRVVANTGRPCCGHGA